MTKKILVFGKKGQVASKLSKYSSVINFGREDIDFLKPKECVDAIFDLKPSFVINAAAFTNVDRCEAEKDKAKKINAITPGEIAKACNKINAHLLHLSTEFVFDGYKKLSYLPNDSCRPLNFYGKTKLLGEQNIKKNISNFIILRTSWIFSENSNNFVRKIIKLSKNQSRIKVVSDQIGGPTYSGDIARALVNIIKKLKLQNISGIYNFSGYPDVSRYEFALELNKYIKNNLKIEKIKSENLTSKINRPLNSRLNCLTTKRDFNISRPLWKTKLIKILN